MNARRFAIGSCRATRLLVACCTQAILSAGGCASYVTPAGAADLSMLADDAGIQRAFERAPTAPFPAHLAVARLQESGYRSHSHESYGTGQFSVVTTRDVETDEDMAHIAAMPYVNAVAPLNRLIIPPRLDSLRAMRLAAAELQADLLLIYTFDTRFRVRDNDVGPLGVITLGFLPNQEARVTTTASAAFCDVRTGYLYGLAESTAFETRRANAWRTSDAVDDARQVAERSAFDGLLAEIESTWGGIIETYAQ